MDGHFAALTSSLDVSDLRLVTPQERLTGLLLNPRLFALMRRFMPIARLPFMPRVVTRYEDVKELLSHEQVFHVEGSRIARANQGHNFLLGMQDSNGHPSHRDYQHWVNGAFRSEDHPRIAALCARVAREALEDAALAARSGPCELDAIQRLVAATSIAICEGYYGLIVSDPRDFANCALAISRWLFDPLAKSRFERLGLEASERLNQLIERSIELRDPRADTIITRLLAAKLDRVAVRVILFSMVVGLVPTSTMAGGHIVEVLLEHPDFLRQAQRAAQRDDDYGLRGCLFEAMRFMPLLGEPLRVCAAPYKLAAGTWRATRFRPGQRVIAFTASAMMDERKLQRPELFNPRRPREDYMLFGYGQHRCIGAPLTEVQIPQTLKPLLRTANVRRAPGEDGDLRRIGPFPEHLTVCFDPN